MKSVDKPLTRSETLTLDLSCIIVRLEMLNGFMVSSERVKAAELWDMILTQDVPRLRSYPGVATLLAQDRLAKRDG